MAILDRVKQRAETDLDDAELQRLIDEANNDIITKFGAHANPSTPVEELLEGDRKWLVVTRPIDSSEPIVITEYYDYEGFGETTYVVASNDYRFWPPTILERRSDGTSSTPRSQWGTRVRVHYVPINDGDQREEVIIKLVMLAIAWDGSGPGLRSTSVGDVTTTTPDYVAERNKILSVLQPRGGLMLR